MSDQLREIRRGDIYYAGLDPAVGSEQGGARPVLIVSNNLGNRHGPIVIVAAITSRMTKHRLPTHVPVCGEVKGLYKDSIVLLEQVRAIDRSRLQEYLGKMSEADMAAVDSAIEVSLGLAPDFK
ncbi:MAG: type II toxin-antitoxin system PemK/MazF family toxin [Spirochaetaceae bacterium]|jgi:mRNA interferase MazF|nr:type II toxin-antitoxin system PemK/MazF family toxin [Spirochaetaceae bacterium]